MEKPVNLNITKFEQIDILRGLAIIMVIVVHVSQIISGDLVFKSIYAYGQMGVQMFFLASAFTLSYSMDYRHAEKNAIKFFFLRRFFRIAPGYYIGIIIYFLLGVLLNYFSTSDSLGLNHEPKNIIINILFLNGLFPEANNNVVPDGWSIGTEMIFYLIFPLIFKFYKIFEKKRILYLSFPVIYLILLLIFQIILIKVLGKNAVIFSNNNFFYYSIVNQLPVFLLGMSMYFAFKDRLLSNMQGNEVLIISLLASFLSLSLMNLEIANYYYVFALTPFISGISFFFLFAWLVNRGTRNNLLEKTGLLSYSCYLIHFIFIYYFSKYYITYLDFLQTDLKLLIVFSISYVLTFLSSKLFYKYIELPGISIGKNIINKLTLKPKVESIV